MQYWAMRTHRDYPEVIMAELRDGRLRQGWGYEQQQDLREVAKIWTPDGGDWDRLSSAQQETWRHFALLGARPQDMQVGDVVLLPNLPDPGTFSLCRIAPGDYVFKLINMDTGYEDCGHVRPANLIPRCDGIWNDNTAVGPGLRRTLRCRSRLWRVDHLQDEIDKIIASAAEGENFDAGGGTEVRLARLLGEVRHALREAEREVRGRIKPRITIARLRDVARAEKLEDILVSALKSIFPPPIRIDHTGGSGEMGADIVVRLLNPFEPEEDNLILVQLKDHDGVSDEYGLEQLENAIGYYGGGDTKQGRVIEVVYAMLADSFTPNISERAEALERETGVKVRLVDGARLISIIAEGLLELAANQDA